MFGRKTKTEWKRVCARDGATWFVPDEVRQGVKKSTLRKAKAGARNERITSFMSPRRQGSSPISERLALLEDKAARATDASRCPTCGSQSYAEVEVPIA